MAANEKKKQINWTTILVPLLVLLAAGWFAWRMFQPQPVDTSEGLEILKGTTVERVVVNDGTQQVNLTLV